MITSDYNYDQTISSSSRYSNTQIINNHLEFFDIDSKNVISNESQEQQFTITKDYEYRLDKISYLFYENTNMWYYIMMYNKQYDISYYKEGIIINIPYVI